MGWSSAGPIFDSVANALVELNAPATMKRKVLGDLIGALQDGDWDTEDESLDQFKHDPAIVEAFADHAVYIRCLHADPGNEDRECMLRVGHDGGHAEYEGGPTWNADGEPRFVLCSYGEGRAHGSGCIRQQGHAGTHMVTNGDEDDD